MLVKELKGLLKGTCHFHVLESLFMLGSDEPLGNGFFEYEIIVNGETIPNVLNDYLVLAIGTRDPKLVRCDGIHCYVGQNEGAMTFWLEEQKKKETKVSHMKEEFLFHSPVMTSEKKNLQKRRE